MRAGCQPTYSPPGEGALIAAAIPVLALLLAVAPASCAVGPGGEPALICRAISRRCKTVSGDLRVTMWLCRWPPSPPCGGGEGAAIAAAIAAGSSPHPRAPAAAWAAIAAQLRALLPTLSSC